MKNAKFVLLVPLFFTTACDLVEDCSGTITATYNIGSDVTTDFNVDEVSFTAEVLTSDCKNLPAGETTEDTVSNITRTDDELSFDDGEELVSATISGTSIGEFSRTENFPGCSVTVVLTGTLESTDNTIVTTGEFTASGATCNADL